MKSFIRSLATVAMITAFILWLPLLAGCNSLALQEAGQAFARGLANNPITVTQGDEVVCQLVKVDGRDIVIRHKADQWEQREACRSARIARSIGQAMQRE